MLAKLEVQDLTRIVQLSAVMSLVMDDPEEVRVDILVSCLPLIKVYRKKNSIEQHVEKYFGLSTYSCLNPGLTISFTTTPSYGVN